MNPKFLILLGLALFVFAAEVSAHCPKCGMDSGYDACGCSDTFVQPVHVEKPHTGCKTKVICKKITTGVEEFEPIGDACGCTNVKVQPAVLPRPKCTWHEKKESKKQYYDDSFESYEHPKYIRAPKYMHDFGDHDQEEETETTNQEEESGVPVDVVSMNIAQQMLAKQHTCKTDEQLFYGFKTLPIERTISKLKTEVPEEILNTYSRKVVELQSPTTVVKCGKHHDDEIAVESVNKPVTYLSYGDLGYTAVKPKHGHHTKFVKKHCKYGGSDEYDSNEYTRKYYKKHSDSSEEIKEILEGSDEEEVYKVPVKKSVFIKKMGGCGCD